MIGSQSDPGIMVRVMEDLFIHSKSQGKQQGVQYKVTVSFLEVYNENIRDLLSDVEEYLDLREDPIKGPVVASITEIEATSGQEIMQLLHQGNAKRSQAATAANEVSSRSHAVLQVVVECRDRAPGTVANIKVGKLSLVDLAGSERAANTKNVGQRLVEGANINRSLLALGNCINALGEKGNKGNFVPYRDSKLTRLLKDSLGGNCRTVMIANISSAESSFEETLNTLKYANRAKNIKTNVQRNVLNVNYHISEYVELINNLRGEIQVLKNQIAHSNGPNDLRGSSSQLNRELSGAAGAPQRATSPLSLNHGAVQNSPFIQNRHEPSTPFQALRESLKSATAGGEAREMINNMRQRIVDNFQERMQLRRSLIELEDQNVQNSIEVSKRQLIVVQWSEKHGNFLKKGGTTKTDFAAYIMANGSPEIMEAWQECEQLRKAIIKNNGMKKNIAKRLRHNEKEAEKFREELGENVTGEDRRELMALQYQVGRLELENMELEQHRIVHESILKGKDLVIQKLRLQLAVRDKLINRQQAVLKEHNLDGKVGYEQLALMEETLMVNEHETMAPPSPPRNMADILDINGNSNYSASSTPEQAEGKYHGGSAHKKHRRHHHHHHNNHSDHDDNPRPKVPKLRIAGNNEKSFSEDDQHHGEDDDDYEELAITEREVALTSRDRDIIEQGEWSEIQSELSDQSFSLGNNPGNDKDRQGNKKNRKDRDRENNIDKTPSDTKSNPVKQEVQSKLSSIKESKGVHGPRGGRVYRSSVNNNATPSSNKETPNDNHGNNNFYGNNRNGGNGNNSYHNRLANNLNTGDDCSDDDSINQRFQSKYRHYHSPRANNPSGKNQSGNSSFDKLEPISKENTGNDEGIFSARKIDKDSSSSKIDASPRINDNNFAVIYPANSGNKRDNVGKHNRNEAIGSNDILMEGGKRDKSNNIRNSKGVIDEDHIDFVINDINENINEGLVIKSKPLGGKPVLGKIKAPPAGGGSNAALPSSSNQTNANNPPVAPGELNILGSGFEGMNNNMNNRLGNRASKPSIR